MLKDKKHLIVYNKKETISKEQYIEGAIYISALNKDISDLEKEIGRMFNMEEINNLEPSLCSSREIGLLNKVKENLLLAKKEAILNVSLDLVSISLKVSYDSIKEILGEEASVDLEKEIFSRFCLGK